MVMGHAWWVIRSLFTWVSGSWVTVSDPLPARYWVQQWRSKVLGRPLILCRASIVSPFRFQTKKKLNTFTYKNQQFGHSHSFDANTTVEWVRVQPYRFLLIWLHSVSERKNWFHCRHGCSEAGTRGDGVPPLFSTGGTRPPLPPIFWTEIRAKVSPLLQLVTYWNAV